MTTSGSCPAFDLQYPATLNCGPITACPLDTIVLSDCATIYGDSVFKLYDASGKQVGLNDDGCGGGGGSKITYMVPSTVACQEYTLTQACYTNYSCSGTTAYTVSPPQPSAPPTTSPTIVVDPAINGTCPPFSTVGYDFIGCGPITACSRDTLTVSDCDACSADSNIALYDNDGYFVSGGEYCPGSTDCYLITYPVPDNTGCVDYTVRQGCFGNAACNGTTTYNVTHSTDPSAEPSLRPTAEPTAPMALVGFWEVTDPTVPCGTNTGTVYKDLDQCVSLGNLNGVRSYGIIHCDSQTADSAWNVKAYSDNSCTDYVGSGQGEDACTCYTLPQGADDDDSDLLGFSVSVDCAGNYNNTCPTVPSTLQKAYLTFYGADNCDGESAGVPNIPMGLCVPLSGEGQYAIMTCAGTTSDSPWTIKSYNTSACHSHSLMTTTVNNGACACNSLNADYVDDYVNGVAMTLNCGSAIAPASCDFGASSDGLSSAAIGGIVGGVLGFVLIATIVGLWIGGVIGVGAASSSAAAVGTAAGGTGAAGSTSTGAADVEMSVNPMAPPTTA